MPAYTSSLAYSFWQDSLTVTGGNVGDVVNLSFSGRTTYDLALYGGAIALAPAVSLNQDFSAGGTHGAGQVSFTTADFAANAGIGFLDWTLALAAQSGDDIYLVMSINMVLSGGNFGGDLGTTNKGVSFDSSHTALLTTLDVTDGYGLASSSGQLVANGSAFAYSAVLAEGGGPTTVPEPSTYALMIAGLGVMGLMARRRNVRIAAI